MALDVRHWFLSTNWDTEVLFLCRRREFFASYFFNCMYSFDRWQLFRSGENYILFASSNGTRSSWLIKMSSSCFLIKFCFLTFNFLTRWRLRYTLHWSYYQGIHTEVRVGQYFLFMSSTPQLQRKIKKTESNHF